MESAAVASYLSSSLPPSPCAPSSECAKYLVGDLGQVVETVSVSVS
jgi:hypothetical protein